MKKAELQSEISKLNNSLRAVTFSPEGIQDISTGIDNLASVWVTDNSEVVIQEMREIYNDMLEEVEKIKTVMFGITEMTVKLDTTKMTTGITDR